VSGGERRAPSGASRPSGTVSAVVVNYRSAELTAACVASLRADGVDEVVVVDSASGDDCQVRLAAADPKAIFVPMAGNRGYGAAANAGVGRTGGDVVLICNPDLIVTPGTVPALVATLDADPLIGAAGPRIDRSDGTRYPSARTFPSLAESVGHGFVGLLTTDNRWSRSYLRTGAEAAGPVDWVSGAFVAVRRPAWDAVGGFDESYFMFMEDVDLCWRLHRAGWGVAYAPGGRVVHLEGASRSSAPYRMIVAHHRSLLRYAWRTGSWRERAMLPLVAAGLAVRTAILSARRAVRPPTSSGLL
jgi:N-acetylglucosaminyl-diphospho-decaprenol L-rhamnosyltransferase